MFEEFEVFSLLVAAEANLEGKPMFGQALKRDDLRFARLLIKNGADVRERGLLYIAAAGAILGAVSLHWRLEQIRAWKIMMEFGQGYTALVATRIWPRLKLFWMLVPRSTFEIGLGKRRFQRP